MSNILLDVQGLDKSFGGIHAVKRLNLRVNKGDIVGLIGPNGSGKSTVVNLIAGVYKPDSGSVKLDGRDITSLPTAATAEYGVARTFQSSRPFLSLSVIENVIAGCLLHERSVTVAREQAMELIKLCGLSDFTGFRSGSLPVEKRKRLDLCRALATRPKLLMLDEVMAGLNPREMEGGIDLVRKVNASGVTIIFIEHVIKAVVSLCNRAVVLNQGELLAEGNPTDVVRDENVIRAYLGEGYKNA